MEIEEWRRVVIETDNQIEALRARIARTVSVDAESFTARSSDGEAIATISADGQRVLNVTLSNGFGSLDRPAWALSGDLDRVCRAIVEAINGARRNASLAVVENLRQEFPEAFDLLTDLQ
ncbi:hypothetical protein [Nocardia macrotermitis]|uniref:hypothetical protein n=1 Tax=Nocardia macrotermitis TaxID=2585198 RepID=UPI0012956754|nr:hypothetical protein [Nocardia macrotermitis]